MAIRGFSSRLCARKLIAALNYDMIRRKNAHPLTWLIKTGDVRESKHKAQPLMPSD